MAKMSTDELLDAFKEMTLLELSEFVKKFEDVFEVTAAAPVAVAAAAPAAKVAPAWRNSRPARREARCDLADPWRRRTGCPSSGPIWVPRGSAYPRQ